MKTKIYIYSPNNERTKPIKIKLTKDELQKIIVNLYKKINIHPTNK